MTDSTNNDKLTAILRQSNPSGRLTYYIPTRYGIQKITRPTALAMIERGDAYWAGSPMARQGGPGAPTATELLAAANEGNTGALAGLMDNLLD